MNKSNKDTNERAYIDANVFISAFIHDDELGKRARSILHRVVSGTLNAITSYLTFDEVYWILKKNSPERALTYTRSFLETPRLVFAPVDSRTTHLAIALIEQHDLNPRDAIHAATAITHACTRLITCDQDFNSIKELTIQKI